MEKFYSLMDYPNINPEIKNQIINEATCELRSTLMDFMFKYKYITYSVKKQDGYNLLEEALLKVDFDAMLDNPIFEKILNDSRQKVKKELERLDGGG